MSKELEKARELVTMLEERERKNKVRLDEIPVGGKFDTGIGRFIATVDMQRKDSVLHAKVRPLTFDEARKYNDLLVNKDLPDWYWTCTAWSTEERGWGNSVAVVSPSGFFYDCNCNDCIGVRPFCILKSNIFVSKVTEE